MALSRSAVKFSGAAHENSGEEKPYPVEFKGGIIGYTGNWLWIPRSSRGMTVEVSRMTMKVSQNNDEGVTE